MVKLANFELTPDRPSYPGGNWHIEGLKNEGIVAVGIYYYQNENITFELNMRESVSFPHFLPPEFLRPDLMEEVYGIQSTTEEQLTEKLGAITPKEGMGLAFPNHYHHKVSPYELIDKTKKGHRKILVFFLVDPSKPIVSTKDIPPQQRDWMISEFKEDDFGSTTLPKLVLDEIFDRVGWPMSLSDAKKYRQQLISERNHWAQYQKSQTPQKHHMRDLLSRAEREENLVYLD